MPFDHQRINVVLRGADAVGIAVAQQLPPESHGGGRGWASSSDGAISIQFGQVTGGHDAVPLEGYADALAAWTRRQDGNGSVGSMDANPLAEMHVTMHDEAESKHSVEFHAVHRAARPGGRGRACGRDPHESPLVQDGQPAP